MSDGERHFGRWCLDNINTRAVDAETDEITEVLIYDDFGDGAYDSCPTLYSYKQYLPCPVWFAASRSAVSRSPDRDTGGTAGLHTGSTSRLAAVREC